MTHRGTARLIFNSLLTRNGFVCWTGNEQIPSFQIHAWAPVTQNNSLFLVFFWFYPQTFPSCCPCVPGGGKGSFPVLPEGTNWQNWEQTGAMEWKELTSIIRLFPPRHCLKPDTAQALPKKLQVIYLNNLTRERKKNPLWWRVLKKSERSLQSHSLIVHRELSLLCAPGAQAVPVPHQSGTKSLVTLSSLRNVLEGISSLPTSISAQEGMVYPQPEL